MTKKLKLSFRQGIVRTLYLVCAVDTFEKPRTRDCDLENTLDSIRKQ